MVGTALCHSGPQFEPGACGARGELREDSIMCDEELGVYGSVVFATCVELFAPCVHVLLGVLGDVE